MRLRLFTELFTTVASSSEHPHLVLDIAYFLFLHKKSTIIFPVNHFCFTDFVMHRGYFFLCFYQLLVHATPYASSQILHLFLLQLAELVGELLRDSFVHNPGPRQRAVTGSSTVITPSR